MLGAAADDRCEDTTVTDVAGLTQALNTTCPNKTITFTRPVGSPPAALNVSLVVRSNIVLVCSGDGPPHFTCPASAPCIASNAFVGLEVRGCSLYGGGGVHVNGLQSLSLINVTVDMCQCMTCAKSSTTPRLDPVSFGEGDGYVSPFSCVFVRNTSDLRIVGTKLSRGYTNANVLNPAGRVRISFGGCLSVANTTRVEVTSSIITNCTLATRYCSGGCVGFDQCSTVIFVDTLISQCKSCNRGGALFAEISTLVLRNCTVRDSSSRLGGCVSLFANSKMVASESRVMNCSSSENGGAIHAEFSSELTLFNSTVSNSTAPSGGCIFNVDNSSVAVLSSLLLDCAIVGERSTLSISGTTFENAIAPPGMSCIFQQQNVATIANSTFINCGAIETEFVTFTMTDSVMRTSDSSGPCLSFHNPTSAPRLEASDFSGCGVAYLIFNGSVLYTPKTEKALWTLYETLWSDALQTGMMIRQPMTVSRSYGACAHSNRTEQSPVTNDDGYAQCRSRWGATALCPLQTGAVNVSRILRSTVTGSLDTLQPNRTLHQGRMSGDGYEYSPCLYLDVFNDTPPPLPATKNQTAHGPLYLIRRIIVIFTTVGSLLGGDPFLGGTLSGINRLQECEFQSMNELDFGSHPTGVFMGEQGDSYMSAMTGNGVIVFAAWPMVAVGIWKRLPAMISMGIKIHMLILSGIITPGMHLAEYSNNSFRALGAIAVFMYMAISAIIFFVVFSDFKATSEPEPFPTWTKWTSVFRMVGWRSREWKSTDTPERFVKSYGTLFQSRRPERQWMIVIDFIFAVAYSAVVSVAKAPCETLALYGTVVLVVEFVVTCLLMSESTMHFQILIIVVAAMKAALVSFTLYPVDDGIVAVVAFVLSVCSVMKMVEAGGRFIATKLQLVPEEKLPESSNVKSELSGNLLDPTEMKEKNIALTMETGLDIGFEL